MNRTFKLTKDNIQYGRWYISERTGYVYKAMKHNSTDSGFFAVFDDGCILYHTFCVHKAKPHHLLNFKEDLLQWLRE